MAQVCYNTLAKLDSRPHPWDNQKHMAADRLSDDLAIQSPFTLALERYRKVFFALLVLPYLAAFNGQWRIGLDSAIYRGLAESLSEGRGYSFGGIAQHQVYPGLPALLAGIDRATGSRLVVPLLLMTAAALLTLALVYHLLLRHVPRWVAVVVTCGVAMNTQFVQQSQELMTDTPFLLGMTAALFGWELLRSADSRWGIARAMVVLLLGLALAASMRPTFWVLAIAWAGVCGWRVVRHRDQRAALALASLVAVWLLVVSVDPRFTGMNVFKGRYEAEAFSRLQEASSALQENWREVLGGRFTEAFFNQPLYPFAQVFTAFLLVGSALMLRRQPLWGLPVFLIFAVTLLMSDVPRYYMMVLPFVWLGYVLVLCELVRRLPRRWATGVLFTAFSLANFLNLAGVGKLILEQHNHDFLKHYKDGSYVQVVALAGMIREHVKPDEGVIGPYSSILTYLSGRVVLGGRELLSLQPVSQYPRLVASVKPAYLVGPNTLYKKKDGPMYRVLDRGIVLPGRLVAGSHDLWIAEALVTVPAGDWRELPDALERKAIAATQPAPGKRVSVARKKPSGAKTRAAVARQKKHKPVKLFQSKPPFPLLDAYIDKKLRKRPTSSAARPAVRTPKKPVRPGAASIGSRILFPTPPRFLSMKNL